MNYLTIYLIGLAITGLLESLLIMNQDYLDFMYSEIEEAKQSANVSTDMVDNDFILHGSIFLDSLLSWFGLIIAILHILNFFLKRKYNN